METHVFGAGRIAMYPFICMGGKILATGSQPLYFQHLTRVLGGRYSIYYGVTMPKDLLWPKQ
jgi:hypothetical protein